MQADGPVDCHKGERQERVVHIGEPEQYWEKFTMANKNSKTRKNAQP